MKRLALLALLLASPALAQAPSPAQMGITSGTPQVLQTLDSAKNWVPIGSVDATSHTFTGMGGEITLKSFGAKCDGTTDDTAAIQAWLAKGAVQTKLVGMPGQCVFKSALTIPAVDDLIVDFAGAMFRYQGTNTTINLLSLGISQTFCPGHRIAIRNITLTSDTVMTAGDGWFHGAVCYLTLDRVYFGNNLGLPNNLYNGCHFAGGNNVYITNYTCRGTNISEIDNGNDDAHGGVGVTDMYHYNGGIANGRIGINVAGNCGGCYWDSIDVVSNSLYNVLIDQSLTPGHRNSQVRFGPNFASDGTPGTGVRIADPVCVGAPGPGRCGSAVFCIGCWISTASVDCLAIDAGAGAEIHLVGARIENCHRYGINNASSDMHLIIDGGAIAQASDTGIFNTAVKPWIQFLAYPSMYGNISHDFFGFFPTVVSGCGGAGAAINVNSDYDYQVQWGSTAGQTTCQIAYGLYHARGSSVATIATIGINTTGNITANSATGQTFVLQASPASGNIIAVRNGGLGF